MNFPGFGETAPNMQELMSQVMQRMMAGEMPPMFFDSHEGESEDDEEGAGAPGVAPRQAAAPAVPEDAEG